jgi:LysM repeat protein
LLTILDNITNALNGDIVRAMRPEILDDIRRYTQKIAAVSDALDNVTNVAADLITSPLTITRGAMDSCMSIVQVTSELQDKVLAKCTFDWFQSAKKLVSPGATSLEPEQDIDIQPSDMNAMRDLQRQIAQENRRLRDEAESHRRAIETPIEQLLTTYRAREDESVREVSQRFYGTPDHWREIMEFNDLDDSTLYAGQPILIPRL